MIELLVVVSIIIILIGLTSSGVLVAMKKAKQSRAKTEIMNILTAVKLYQSEVGIPPGEINERCLGTPLSKLLAYGTAGDTVIRFGPFYEFKDSSSNGTPGSRTLRDPWDQDYLYVRGNNTADPDYGGCQALGQTAVYPNGFPIVYSIGPNGTADTTDDIGTWQ